MPFPEWHPPFSPFSSFSVVWGAKPLFSVGRMQIRHFRRFRQNGPFLAGDKNTVYQKHGLPKTRFVRPRILTRKSQLDTLRFGTQFPKSHWPLSFSAPKSQRFKSQRLQAANATKSQTLAFYKSQRFSATKFKGVISSHRLLSSVC